jgi:hypothetical protein
MSKHTHSKGRDQSRRVLEQQVQAKTGLTDKEIKAMTTPELLSHLNPVSNEVLREMVAEARARRGGKERW